MIAVDFESKIPIYKQIVEQLMRAIKSGALRPGQRLPTERELAESLQVARGTVKRAYKELSDNNIIEVIHGSGSYVYNDKEAADPERRRKAAALLDETYDTLSAWGLAHREISTLLHITLAKKAPPEGFVRVAVIDCNPESLAIMKRQLNYIPGIVISAFFVDTILLDDDADSLLNEFDLVLTTVTHYDQVAKQLVHNRAKLMAADVSPSRHTIVSICALPHECTVGIVCQSNKFANLIAEQVELFSAVHKNLPASFETDVKSTRRFMKKMGAVIAAPDSFLFNPALSGSLLEDYTAAGGTVIPFDYLIDRGSLLHIEEQIDRIISRKQARG